MNNLFNWAIGILVQIFIVGLGLWILVRILHKKYDPPNLNSQILTKGSHDSICAERLNFINENFTIKFEYLNNNIQELKADIKEIRNLIKRE